ncbi:hypothetical protein ACS0TY_029162 [Phlomoides rotata]
MIFLIHGKDWSSHNVFVVGLGNCVYLWHASSSKVVKLCDLGSDDNVCEVLDKGIIQELWRLRGRCSCCHR